MTEPGNLRDIFRLATCAACGTPLLTIDLHRTSVTTTDARCAPCETRRAVESQYGNLSIAAGR